MDLRIPRTDLLTITRLIEAAIGINSQLMPHKDPLMSVSQRACQIWAVLAWAAKHRQSITYPELAQLIGVPTVALGQLLEPIHSYCSLKNLPYLTILVVQRDTGYPGLGFTGVLVEKYAEETAKVFLFDWLKYGNPGAKEF